MCDDNIEIGVTEITNNILVSAQPTDQIIDINVLEEVENVELTITPSVVEVNIDVTQELITEVVTVDANTCVNIVDVTVTDATDNVTLNITPSLVEVNINRGENNLNIEEYDTFADLPTIGDTDTYYITLDENKFWRWDPVDEVYVEISDSNDKIPYLGAYKNSDLGEWGIKSNWLGLDLTPTNPPTVAGTITWNDTDGTADLILKGGNVTLQIGQEQVVRVVNKTGATLNEADFRAVRVRSVSEGGAQGQRLAVLLAMADSDADSATTIGIVTESISNNQEGFITTSGEVKKINTTGAKSYGGAETWVDGDILYLSPTHAGYLTNVKPQAPDHTIIIGWVVYAHANNGKIFVKVDNGYELDELHNVKITTPTNGQGLIYDSTLGVWKNQAITTSLTATSPLSIASNVLSITKADATTDGYLSSADWNYFSAKQQPLSGTGFVKATGSVISYDNTVYTPQSRTLTINGTAYDLSADRSWSISVGSGMRNVSSFVATAGQTTFTIVGGYTAGLVDVFVNGARLNAGDYTATNGTTVVLATGVVANDIVDIINYTASLTSGLTGAGTTNYIAKWSGSSNLTDSQLFDNGTNVGVGTNTPSRKLEVYGATLQTAQMKLWSPSSNLGRALYLGSFGTASYISGGGTYSFPAGWVSDLSTAAIASIILDSQNAESYVSFHTTTTNNAQPSERMRIVGSGNVGIGLTNPSYKLDVVGDVNITGTYRVNGVAIGTGGGTVTGTGTTNYIAKWSGSSAIGNSQIFDNGTNVGIGTSTPDNKLHIVSSAGTQSAIQIAQTARGTGIVGMQASASVPANMVIGTDVTGEIIFKHGIDLTNLGTGTERMRITSAGRVGIGTTSPSGFLHIKGGNNNSLYVDNDGSQYTPIYISNNGSVKGFLVWDNTSTSFQLGAATASPLAFYTNSTERARITSGGTFAIGNAGNGTGYGIEQTITFNQPRINMVDNGVYTAEMRSYNGAVYFQNYSANPVIIGTSGTERMRITSDGIVGIGTSSPSSGFGGTISNVKLALLNGVAGQAGGTSVLLIGGDNNHYSSITAQHTGGGNTYLAFATSTGAVNPSEKMRINSNGTIQIAGISHVFSIGSIAGYQRIQYGTGGNTTEFAFINASDAYTPIGASAFNTRSDYRLKEDLKEFNATDLIQKLKVYDFKWKDRDERNFGFMAHELQEVVPYVVTGQKDGMFEGMPHYQGLDNSKIVPILVQAIKELNAKLEAK